jgi:hypothetical protein
MRPSGLTIFLTSERTSLGSMDEVGMLGPSRTPSVNGRLLVTAGTEFVAHDVPALPAAD